MVPPLAGRTSLADAAAAARALQGTPLVCVSGGGGSQYGMHEDTQTRNTTCTSNSTSDASLERPENTVLAASANAYALHVIHEGGGGGCSTDVQSDGGGGCSTDVQLDGGGGQTTNRRGAADTTLTPTPRHVHEHGEDKIEDKIMGKIADKSMDKIADKSMDKIEDKSMDKTTDKTKEKTEGDISDKVRGKHNVPKRVHKRSALESAIESATVWSARVQQAISAVTEVQLLVNRAYSPVAERASVAHEDKQLDGLAREMRNEERRARGKQVQVVPPHSDSVNVVNRLAQLEELRSSLRKRVHNLEVTLSKAQYHQRLLQGLAGPEVTDRDGDEEPAVTSCLNPHADLNQALERYNETGEVAGGTSGSTGHHNLMIEWEDELAEEIPTGDVGERHTNSQPYFLATSASCDKKYKSASAMVGFEDNNTIKMIQAVVDSGAARSGMALAELRTHFPNHWQKIRPSPHHFHDANGRPMPVVGCVDLYMVIGACRRIITVQVFSYLVVPFLLGTDSMDTLGMTINYFRRELTIDPGAAGRDDCFVPLRVTDGKSHTNDDAVHCVRCGNSAGETAPPIPPTCHRCRLEGTTDAAELLTIRCDEHQLSVEEVRRQHVVRPTAWTTSLRTTADVVLKAGHKGRGFLLEYDQQCPDATATLEVSVGEAFQKQYSTIRCLEGARFSAYNFHAFLYAVNQGARTVVIPAGTVVATATVVRRSNASTGTPNSLAVQLILDEASGMKWTKCLGGLPEGVVRSGIELDHERLRNALAAKTDGGATVDGLIEFTMDEWHALEVEPLRMCHYMRVGDDCYQPAEELRSYAEGGPPRCDADWKDLGLDLSQSIDANRRTEDGNYAAISAEQRETLYAKARRWWWVWSRDARTPNISRLVVIDIPTGTATPIAQKPYPIPYHYREAVLDELRKLLDGGLIEPTISEWGCPILVRLKKDSTPDKIRLKIICDFRLLNQVTLADSASLGDQEEILDGFGGTQRFCGIMDAAGGFYQFAIKPSDRHKTAFVLPTSMGGTSFQWRVAPYGLTRNPAGYSRGMMFTLQHMSNIHLAPLGQSTGGCGSWIDDISMHSDSFEGFADLFERILCRVAFAGMQLKASKCFLLHARLEVLGFFITPDGLVMQGSKLDELEKKDSQGRLVAPTRVEEIRTFLGAVQFYRRFIPRLSLLAAPMTSMLKKDAKSTPEAWEGVRQSFEAIMMFLKSDAVVSAPDLKDPMAEYVICTDACDVAAGGVLLQWQHPTGKGPRPPNGVPMRGDKDSDPLTQSWRLDHGYKLRTIAYYSKTLDQAQRNYPTFDKESAAILFCVRRWAKIITGRPTTLYTDSSVAASMLHKHLGPPRLQRWGMELGTFLPYLKVAYRRGVDNGMADFLSRYPTFQQYVTPREEPELPSELFDLIPEAVPLFTHRLGDDDAWLEKWKLDLYEAKNPVVVESVWQHQMLANGDIDSEDVTLDAPGPELMLLAAHFYDTTKTLRESRTAYQLPHKVSELREAITAQGFWQEQREFDEYCQEWESNVQAFEEIVGRAPVVYDLCCGEGGFSRGARLGGAECYGFDTAKRHRKKYENDYGHKAACALPSGMKFTQTDIISADFWEELRARGRVGSAPAPDFIHASPPCRHATRLRKTGARVAGRDMDICLDWVIAQLKLTEHTFQTCHNRPLLWSVENVPESLALVKESVTKVARLCGSQMGHRVFRHRVFYCNFDAVDNLPHSHKGKWVGSRGVRYSEADDDARYGHLPPPNMYGVYSKPGGPRGSLDEWHGALGYNPNTFSAKGIVGALPISYGRLLFAQAVAHGLARAYGRPVVAPGAGNGLAAHREWPTRGDKMTRAGDNDEDHDDAPVLVERGDSDVAVGIDLITPPAEEASLAPVPRLADEVGGASFSPYVVTREEQARDPALHLIVSQLESGRNRVGVLTQLQRTYEMNDGLLYRRSVSHEGEPCLKLMVPRHGVGPLLRRFHFASHRGHEPLYEEVSGNFHWDRIKQDCATFTNACAVCGATKSRTMVKAPVMPVPTPARPFEVIHIDHKGPLRRSGGFTNVMVVVCALTRFTLYIPVTSTTGDDTIKALMARVFSVFGFPLVMVTDNGPAFINNLQRSTAQFFGYRHVPILPYNAAANGAAEASVKRLKLLLDRHLDGYAEWHKILPLAQLQLNSHVHTGLRISPYMALFGRQPFGIEHLENPSLLKVPGTGSEWLAEYKDKMLRLHRELRAASDEIKEARATAANARRQHEFDSRSGRIRASTADQPSYVRMIKGSFKDAEYLRKHGHGTAWKNRYKVLEVRPHAVRLEVPKDGSVPIVNEWQLIRRCEPAPAHEEMPHDNDPELHESGYRIPTPSVDRGPTAVDDDTVYEIDRILSAEKVHGRYRLWIKWKDHADATPEWKSDIERQTSHPELLQEIQDAVQRCREQLNEGREDDDPVVRDELAAEDGYHSGAMGDGSASEGGGGDASAGCVADRLPRRHASRRVPGVH